MPNVSALWRNLKSFGAKILEQKGVSNGWMAVGCGVVLITIGVFLKENIGRPAANSAAPQQPSVSVPAASDSPQTSGIPRSPAPGAGDEHQKAARITGTVKW